MSDMDPYVTTGPNGVMSVGKAAVPLESVLAGFEQGHAPETIRSQYPTLSLEEVYGAITYSLAHPNEVQEYLKRQDVLWEQWRQRLRQGEPPVVERLRAIQQTQAGQNR
jgi:Protein of unknown function (DUF433)